MQKQYELSGVYKDMRLAICCHILDRMRDGTLPKLVFADEMKFNAIRMVEAQLNGSIEDKRVNRRQRAISHDHR